jgi:DUF4097 and DUF4098 domain-containing protein YvlB
MIRPQPIATAASLALTLALLPALSFAQPLRGQFDKSLKASAPVTLSVTSGSGSVTVNPGPDGTVRVVGTIRGNTSWTGASEEAIRRAVNALEAAPPIVQNGSTITVGRIDDEEARRHVSISYEVTVPSRTALAVTTGSGSQQIGALTGSVEASSGSGSLTIGAIDGRVDARAGSGSIKIGGAKERVSASTGSGGIDVGRVSGQVMLNSGSGTVHVDAAPDATIDVNTGSGGIEVSGLVGGLSARASSGSIRIAGTPKSDWQLSTSSGSIRLAIPDGTAFRVQASTSSGSIETDHKLAVSSVGRRELAGSVGSGGALISARSSSGSISISR